MTPQHSSIKVWYDAGCPLCRREIRLLKKLDTRQQIEFVDLHTAMDCPVDRRLLLERLHAQEPQGNVLSGAAAFALIWRAIPLLSPLGMAAKWPPLLWLLERFYVRFLSLRPSLQRIANKAGL
ncbi:MAG: DUF393 domain-containing protein [Candidatus Thiodiazotropha sp.]